MNRYFLPVIPLFFRSLSHFSSRTHTTEIYFGGRIPVLGNIHIVINFVTNKCEIHETKNRIEKK